MLASGVSKRDCCQQKHKTTINLQKRLALGHPNWLWLFGQLAQETEPNSTQQCGMLVIEYYLD